MARAEGVGGCSVTPTFRDESSHIQPPQGDQRFAMKTREFRYAPNLLEDGDVLAEAAGQPRQQK